MEGEIVQLLKASLVGKDIQDALIEVENISHKHAGHFKGSGQSHFVVRVKSRQLMQIKPLERHRVLNGGVSHLINSGKVHAISFEVGV